MSRVDVDPIIVTCAVRYALPRHSYICADVAATVRANWKRLGDQQQVITRDLADFVAEYGRPDQPAIYAADTQTWRELLQWIEDR